MAPRTPQPLLAALAEHPRQGTPHRGELTRSIEAADNRARDRLSDDPDAVYGVWKCLRTVRVAAISKTRARYVNARTTTDGAPPASRPAGTRPQAVVVHAEPRSHPPTRAAAPAAVQEVRDTTPARPTRAPPSPARTHSDQRAGRLASPRPPSSATGLTSSRTTARQTAATSSSSSASCTSPSPSTSWTPRDADRSRCVRRFSSTLARGVSSSKFSRQGAFSRARAFRGSKNEKRFTNATRAANGPPDRADSISDTPRDGAATDRHLTRRTVRAFLSRLPARP
jgi:hypothetical protein